MISDRDKLLDELESIEIAIASTDLWTPDISRKIIRKKEIQDLLKSLGKKDWFK